MFHMYKNLNIQISICQKYKHKNIRLVKWPGLEKQFVLFYRLGIESVMMEMVWLHEKKQGCSVSTTQGKESVMRV